MKIFFQPSIVLIVQLDYFAYLIWYNTAQGIFSHRSALTVNNFTGASFQKRIGSNGNEAVSDVNITLDGVTYPGWK